MCMGILNMTDAQGGQKSTMESQELGLQKVVPYHVSARDQTWVLCESYECPYLLSLLWNPYLCI